MLFFNRIIENVRHVANFICLITKQYIYSQRCLKQDLVFSVLRNRILKIENIEKFIAVKNGKKNLHDRKWYHSVLNSEHEDMQQYAIQYLEKL